MSNNSNISGRVWVSGFRKTYFYRLVRLRPQILVNRISQKRYEPQIPK